MRTLTHKELADLWDVRCCLEAAAARLAAARITDIDLAELRTLCSLHENAAVRHGHRAVDRAEIAFHLHIVEMSDNHLIRRIFQDKRLLDRIFGIDYRIETLSPEDGNATVSHRQLVEALALRDPLIVEGLMIQHIQGEKERRLAALGNMPITEWILSNHPTGP
jgi:DNA-binding GntR family transcriptional regulator